MGAPAQLCYNDPVTSPAPAPIEMNLTAPPHGAAPMGALPEGLGGLLPAGASGWGDRGEAVVSHPVKAAVRGRDGRGGREEGNEFAQTPLRQLFVRRNILRPLYPFRRHLESPGDNEGDRKADALE